MKYNALKKKWCHIKARTKKGSGLVPEKSPLWRFLLDQVLSDTNANTFYFHKLLEKNIANIKKRIVTIVIIIIIIIIIIIVMIIIIIKLTYKNPILNIYI